MGIDDLEPGQDDLVKEDRLSTNIAKKVKDLPKAVGGEESIYTNHKAGSPEELTPKAEQDTNPERRSGGSPVRKGLFSRIRSNLMGAPEAMKDAKEAARITRQERETRRDPGD